MKKRLVLIILSAVILITAGYFLFLRGSTPTYNFRLDTISKGDITTYVTTTGTLNAVTSIDVGTQVSGIISKIYADFNSIVKKGQVIALLDTTLLYQSVKNNEASLERTNAQLADSKRTLDREKVLFDKGLDTQANYDAAKTVYEVNEAARKQAQAALEGAKINLSYATIYAPIDGVVINRQVNIGQTVASSFSSPTLFTIANDLSKMQVLATVDETDVGAVSIGQEASFTVDAYPNQTYNGLVSQIRLAPTSIQNVVNYTVVVDVDNSRLELMPGMTANVKILVAGAGNVLRVPNMALRFQAPANLIDSTKLKTQADNEAGKGRGAVATLGSGTISIDSSKASGPGEKTHHGDKNNQIASTISVPPAVAKTDSMFGIIPSFPEFEKNAPVVNHQSGKGRIWIVNANRQLEPVFVLTGITDGRLTEITTLDLHPGDSVVLGINYISNGANQAANPLTGSGQPRPQRGGGF